MVADTCLLNLCNRDPYIINTIPAQGSNNVSIDSTVQVVFSESLMKGGGSIKVLDNDGNVHFNSTLDSMSLLSIGAGSNNAIEITPGTFDLNKTYSVTIDDYALRAADNHMPAGFGGDTFSFTTETGECSIPGISNASGMHSSLFILSSGNSANISCDPGFEIVGNQVVTCNVGENSFASHLSGYKRVYIKYK